MIGAPGAEPSGSRDGSSGASYVVFGRKEGFRASFELSSLDGSNGFVFKGRPFERSGSSVSAAGDVNGDGIDDLVIGAPRASGQSNYGRIGMAYVVFGSDRGFPASIDPSSLDGNNGFILDGINAVDGVGSSVSAAGDVNGDGLDDVLIGAYNFFTIRGASYVVFGREQGFGASFDLSSLDGNNGFVLKSADPSDGSGRNVSGAGDVNGDGLDDLLIAAHDSKLNGKNSGASYVVFGSDQGFSASMDFSSLNGSNGFVVNGVAENDSLGWSVGRAGDVNGDGVDDLVIGAIGIGPKVNRFSPGGSYVVFGSKQGFPAAIDPSALDGGNGFVINGVAARDGTGSSVSAVGDVNGDGLDDVVIGALFADPNGFRSGASHVVFGSDQGFAASIELSSLDGSNGFVLDGLTRGDSLGSSVSRAGDINGDGVDDLVIGAYHRHNYTSPGAAYVVFGQRAPSPPEITPVLDPVEPDGSSGWYVSDVGLSWMITDPDLSLMIESGCVDQIITTDTDGLTLNCVASSAGGAASESVTLKRDATAPQVAITTPADDAVYVLNQVVTADWRASDATPPGSGLISSSGSTAEGEPVDTSLTGKQTFTVTATDTAGNQTIINHNYTVLSARQAFGVLIKDVRSRVRPRGLEKNLVKKLWKARKALARGKPPKAMKRTNAFINKVNAKSGKRIKPDDAAALIAYAQQIRGAI